MKILALKYRRLGDTVLWSAPLQALRDHFPQAQIDLVLPRAYAELFTGDARFQNVFGVQDAADIALLRKVWREARYDLALVFHASHRTRRWARAARARRTLIHHHDRRGRRFGSDTAIVDAGRPMHAIDRDLNVVRTLGWKGTAPSPRVRRPPPDAPGWTSTRPKILLGPSASRPSKRWPLENYARLTRLLEDRAEVRWIANSAEEFRLFWRPSEAQGPWIFTPTLQDASRWLASADLFVGSDSGIKHLAIALGVRTLTLFGPESLAEWHPYDLDAHPVLQQAVGCRDRDAHDPRFAWCDAFTCPLASHACLRLTTPETVAHAIGRVFQI